MTKGRRVKYPEPKVTQDPFIEHAIGEVSCEFYHRYGMFLAPLTTALITSKYCQLKHTCLLNNINNGDGNTASKRGNTSDFGNTTSPDCTTRVTKNPRKVAAGRKGALARKAKLIHNTEHSTIKTWAPYVQGVVAIAVVLFYRAGEVIAIAIRKGHINYICSVCGIGVKGSLCKSHGADKKRFQIIYERKKRLTEMR